MTDERDGNEFKVLRVTQLDTHELDSELLSQFKLLSEECFKYMRYKFISKYQKEINSAIKIVIWYFTYYKTNQTIGQSILNWSYKSKWNAVSKVVHLIFFCFDDILEEVLENTNKRLFCVWKVLEFLNFLKFLYSGDYLHLWQRICRLKPLYDKEQELREISTDYTERELIWQSYFLLIKLLNSVFNFKTLTVSRLFLSKKNEDDQLVDRKNDDLNSKTCRLCTDASVTNAYWFKSCKYKHLYCYYCIRNYSFIKNLCKFCGKENEIGQYFSE